MCAPRKTKPRDVSSSSVRAFQSAPPRPTPVPHGSHPRGDDKALDVHHLEPICAGGRRPCRRILQARPPLLRLADADAALAVPAASGGREVRGATAASGRDEPAGAASAAAKVKHALPPLTSARRPPAARQRTVQHADETPTSSSFEEDEGASHSSIAPERLVAVHDFLREAQRHFLPTSASEMSGWTSTRC